MDGLDSIPFVFVDSKTVAFTTPPSRLPLNENGTRSVSIVAIQNKEEIARVNFLYQSCK